MTSIVEFLATTLLPPTSIVEFLATTPLPLGALSLRRRLPAPDRLLTCFRLPLFLRGTASLVAFTMLLTSLPFNTLAQEADLYTQLETSSWGRAGTVTQYEYDDNGSLTRKTVTGAGESLVEEYTYDLQNRLASHVRTDSDETGTAVTTTAYRYSPAGGKVGQTTTVVMNGIARPELAENTNYLLDFSNPTGYAQIIEEFDGAGTLLKSYTIGDDVLSQSVHTTVADPQLPTGTASYQQASYFLYDGHGSTRQLANAQGSVTAQYAYDSYGVMLGQTSGAQQRQATSLLYSGEQFDSTLQQYHLRARNYNQANGQFTTLDPYAGNLHDPQSLHKYAYCHTDPVNGVDPSGMFFVLSNRRWGKIVHKAIEDDFIEERGLANVSIEKSIAGSLGLLGMGFEIFFPDMVDMFLHEVYDIGTLKEFPLKVPKVKMYVALYEKLEPGLGWHAGETYQYTSGSIQLEPGVFAIVLGTVEGVVVYQVFDMKTAKQIATTATMFLISEIAGQLSVYAPMAAKGYVF